MNEHWLEIWDRLIDSAPGWYKDDSYWRSAIPLLRAATARVIPGRGRA